jgi:hypothetical protein
VHYCTYRLEDIFYYQFSGKENALPLLPPDKENPGPEQAGISFFGDGSIVTNTLRVLNRQ